MTWYAVEDLDDALDATRTLLTPVDPRQWLRLALVVFFLSGTGGGPSATAGSSTGGPTAAPGGPGGPGGELRLPLSPEEVLSVGLAVVVVGLTLGLLYALVGSVMEFVFVESLRRRRARIRRYADQHLARALRLFGFRLVLGLLVVVPAGGVVLAVLSAATGEPRVSLGLLAVFVPLLALFGILVAAVDVFTTHFVVPVMIGRNLGVLAAWRRFWPTLTREWQQYGVYALVRLVLAFAAGLVSSVVGSVVGAILFVPLAIAGVVAFPALGGPAGVVSNPAALAAGVALLVGYLLAVLVALALVLVPVQTFVRYHALLVLGDTNREFDLIPELRRELREA
ncbi:DUF7544 domain-containing protein [Halorussus salilacus]|uniref:DUF7544 domain-containing protein n=1 Tax=Halorussus salilacus TaxID=2953750 RepID=UPI0026E50C26|nr:hypothetical protein [Halorussus salilacus]